MAMKNAATNQMKEKMSTQNVNYRCLSLSFKNKVNMRIEETAQFNQGLKILYNSTKPDSLYPSSPRQVNSEIAVNTTSPGHYIITSLRQLLKFLRPCLCCGCLPCLPGNLVCCLFIMASHFSSGAVPSTTNTNLTPSWVKCDIRKNKFLKLLI